MNSKSILVLLCLLILAIVSRFITCRSLCTLDDSKLANTLFLINARNNIKTKVLYYLPSPHTELLLGLTVGLNELNKVPKFKQYLVDTGTIHVVVVSGYNISLVFNSLYLIIGKPYDKLRLFLGVFVTLIYSLFTGFEPPIIRAWIMGGILIFGRYYGKSMNTLYVLIISALLMLIWNPPILSSLSFQLSFLATLSLVIYSDFCGSVICKIAKRPSILREDFIATISAQILVWPLISYNFGKVSLISPVINGLVLWTIPLATILGSIFLLLLYFSSFIAKVFVYILYVPLDIFVVAINGFSKLPLVSLTYSVNLYFLLSYYFLLLLFTFFLTKAKDDRRFF